MSALEETLMQQIRWAKLPAPKREYRAVPGRRYRWDLAWPDHMLLVEVQGGIWGKGGHSSGTGIERDTEKLALAILRGWRVLQVTTRQIRDGRALAWIQAALAADTQER